MSKPSSSGLTASPQTPPQAPIRLRPLTGELAEAEQRKLGQAAMRLVCRHGWPRFLAALRSVCEQGARTYSNYPQSAAVWQARADALAKLASLHPPS